MRIAIVNDMALATEALKRVVLSVPGRTIAWTARDGAEALTRARLDRPDVILMDLQMPVMDGVEATRRIMAEAPCHILIVTTTVKGAFERVYDAMAAGALDAVDTPAFGAGGTVQGDGSLLGRLETLGRLARPRITAANPVSEGAVGSAAASASALVLLGASTGGPAALAEVLTTLARERVSASVLIVQHVGPQFAEGLASWLSDQTHFEVALARTGDRPTPGRALLACSNDHLALMPNGALAYVVEPAEYPYRPSVDVLFQSVCRNGPETGVAALLTGMGADGAVGLGDLKARGWMTLAESKESCVVYGMPKAAVERGAARRVLTAREIGPAIASHLRFGSTNAGGR